MTNIQWQESLKHKQLPNNLTKVQKALWYAAEGNWNKAHSIVQFIFSREAAWVHAYLHRVEGDNGNANFWYRNAGKEFPQESQKEELNHIVQTLVLNS